ncbi:MAG: methyltransferase domain-containing protein, partial [Ilumatobacteraceae bacterium]
QSDGMSGSDESTGPATGHYIIRGGAAGRDRLRVLSRVMRSSTERFLGRVSLPAGSTCLDAGCGGGEVARMLAARTGLTGRVVGIDIDPVQLDIVRAECEEARLDNLELRLMDVDHLDEQGAYDLVYSRFVLSHLAEPLAALAALVRAGRPGGTIAVEDVDFAGHFCHPEHSAFSRYCEIYEASATGRGVDPFIGRRLPAMFAAVGLLDIEVHVEQPAGFDPDVKAMAPLTMAAIGEAVVAAGVVTGDEVERLVEQLWEFAEHPLSIMSLPRIVQVSGRVPSG